MTPHRLQRLREVLARRQPDLTVLMDGVHKKHNVSAVIRTCDAVGVLDAHAVWPAPKMGTHAGMSGGSGRWVRVVTHTDMSAAVTQLHDTGLRIVAAQQGEHAQDYRALDYTQPTAFVLGAELDGLGPVARAHADVHALIPMQGMVGSLNVSVAAALFLFEAQRQRLAAGLYERCRLDPARYDAVLFEWAHPLVAAYCRRHGAPYPPMDATGTIVGDFRRAAHERARP
jgi:tRNA (guanosine-2'-O-)-methyltransferase